MGNGSSDHVRRQPSHDLALYRQRSSINDAGICYNRMVSWCETQLLSLDSLLIAQVAHDF